MTQAGMKMWLRQVAAVIRLEMAKTFLSRRGLWVYLLAFAPAAIWGLHALTVLQREASQERYAARHTVTREQMDGIQKGALLEDVLSELGDPYERLDSFPPSRVVVLNYTDGDARVRYVFGPLREPGEEVFRGRAKGGGPPDPEIPERPVVLLDSYINEPDSLADDSLIFATVFQFFYLRLVVFFGCVGVFTNLFRGEMLDKSLHFYLLAPVRRELLMVGKYLSGLIATTVIFTASTGLQLAALMWHADGGEFARYLDGSGWGHIAAYLGVTLAACLGYGSVFLAAGLMFRNPILPAAMVLVWESMNIFLPATLKKISIIYYLQSMSPVVAPPDAGMNPLLQLLITSAEPVDGWIAVLGLFAGTGLVLYLAGRRARRLEINYSAE